MTSDVLDRDENWQAYANCATADPDAFHPEKGGTTQPAKQVCAACTVREQCLAYAIENKEHQGIWGGLSAQERKRLRRAA